MPEEYQNETIVSEASLFAHGFNDPSIPDGFSIPLPPEMNQTLTAEFSDDLEKIQVDPDDYRQF
jgi:hypothetical protein